MEGLVSMKLNLKTTLAAASCALLIACNTDKVPADAAIKAAETSVAAVKVEAQKFAPEQLKAVETALAAAKDQFAKGEYKAALTAATELAGKVKDLGTAAAAKKDELPTHPLDASSGATNVGYIVLLSNGIKDTAGRAAVPDNDYATVAGPALADLAAGLPKSVEEVKAKVEELGKAKKLPKEISADALATAKDGLAKVEGSWKEATDAFGTGNFQDAIAKGTAVKAKVAEIAGLLGIQAAPAAPAAAAPATPAAAPAK